MKTRVLLAGFVTLIQMEVATAQSCNDLSQMDWLLGNWTSENSTQVITEAWEQTSNLTFEGTGITITKASNKVDQEWLRLLVMKDQVFYLAKVDHNSLPTPFQLTSCADKTLTFRNPQHDFPKKIVYQQLSEERLKVTVSDGESRSFVIDFKKEKTNH
jgi:hypothetical protein